MEAVTQVKIYENREKWFETELEMHDIENSFTSPLKIFKSGKSYVLRVNVPCVLGVCNLKIYDEDENEIQLENLKENENIMAILEVKGIKCSSRSFMIEFELKQLMILKPKILFDKCIFKPQNKNNLGNVDYSDTNNEDKILPDIKQTDVLVVETSNFPDQSSELLSTVDNDTFESLGATDEASDMIINTSTNDIENIIIEKKEIADNETEIQNYLKDEIIPDKSVITTNNDDADIFKEMLQEINFNLDEIPSGDVIHIKNRNDVYYKLYNEALSKAKTARDLALSNYLEAKHIKNTYLLQEINNNEEIEF